MSCFICYLFLFTYVSKGTVRFMGFPTKKRLSKVPEANRKLLEIKKHLHVRDLKTLAKLSNVLFCLRDWSRVL